jgi:hypothetical protein
MPIRSPGNVPARTIRDLGLPGRAVTALTRAGVTGIDDLAVLSRRELAAISGLGPGTIAAIRVVVPEPPTSVVRSGTSLDVDPADLAHPAIDPAAETAERESPDAPMIPSFDSLRDPRRRTAVDVLVPGPPPAPSTAAPASGGAPRPADYADLLRLGVRVVGAVAGVPRRVARWAVREPVRCLGRLLGA